MSRIHTVAAVSLFHLLAVPIAIAQPSQHGSARPCSPPEPRSERLLQYVPADLDTIVLYEQGNKSWLGSRDFEISKYTDANVGSLGGKLPSLISAMDRSEMLAGCRYDWDVEGARHGANAELLVILRFPPEMRAALADVREYIRTLPTIPDDEFPDSVTAGINPPRNRYFPPEYVAVVREAHIVISTSRRLLAEVIERMAATKPVEFKQFAPPDRLDSLRKSPDTFYFLARGKGVELGAMDYIAFARDPKEKEAVFEIRWRRREYFEALDQLWRIFVSAGREDSDSLIAWFHANERVMPGTTISRWNVPNDLPGSQYLQYFLVWWMRGFAHEQRDIKDPK